jgi:hypothetical protein
MNSFTHSFRPLFSSTFPYSLAAKALLHNLNVKATVKLSIERSSEESETDLECGDEP